MEETYHLWLAAIPNPIPEEEARIYWNCKDDPTPALDDGLRRASYLYIGSYGDEHEPENLHAGTGHCPANRLHSWLFYIGTIDRYQAPYLDHELMARLVELYRARDDDLPARTIVLPRLESFLRKRLGLCLLIEKPDFEPRQPKRPA